LEPTARRVTPVQTEEYPLAPRWRRLVGFVIDALILTVVTGALWGRLFAAYANRLSEAAGRPAGVAPLSRDGAGPVFSQLTGPYLIVMISTVIVAIIYYWLLTGYWGTTIGKRSVGTWVVNARDQSPVSLRASLLRALVFVLGGEVLPLFFLIDNMWLLWDPRRQALHDKAARTLVVTRPAAVSRRPSSARPPRSSRRRRPDRRAGRERLARRSPSG